MDLFDFDSSSEDKAPTKKSYKRRIISIYKDPDVISERFRLTPRQIEILMQILGANLH